MLNLIVVVSLLHHHIAINKKTALVAQKELVSLCCYAK